MKKYIRFLSWVESYKKWEVILSFLSLVLLIVCGTYGEITSLAASAALCKSSGCVRSDAVGAILMLLIAPLGILLTLGLGYLFLMFFPLSWSKALSWPTFCSDTKPFLAY